MSIELEIKNIVMEHLSINDEPKHDVELSALPNWDSLRALRIMLALEKYFDTKISLKEFLNSKKIEDLLKLVK